MNKTFFVYIVRCADGSYYTGYTVNVKRRINEHNYGSRSAKYTRSRRPVHLVYLEEHDNLSSALKREYQIKKMSRKKKQELVNGYNSCNP